MMRNTLRILVVLVALGFAWCDQEAFADGRDRAGTSAAPELLIPVGARDIALGGASIANSSGIEAIHWNPAGLTWAEADANTMFSTMSYLADMRVNYLAVSGRFGDMGSIAIHLKALDIGDIPITTEQQPDGTGGTFTPTFFTLGVTYARNLTDRIALGTTLNYVSNEMNRVNATGTSFSAGLQYMDLGDIEGLDIGVAVKNIGTHMRFEGPGLLNRGELSSADRGSSFYDVQASAADLPSTFEIGLGYEYPVTEVGAVNVSTLFQHNNYNFDNYKLGLEYVHDNFLYIRGGFDYSVDDGDDEYLFGSSAGLGVQFDIGQMKGVRLDYAYTQADYFDALNTFTFQVGF